MAENDKKDELSKKDTINDSSFEKETSQISQENKIQTDDEDAGQSEDIVRQKKRMKSYIITIVVIVCLIVIFIWGVKGCSASFDSITG